MKNENWDVMTREQRSFHASCMYKMEFFNIWFKNTGRKMFSCRDSALDDWLSDEISELPALCDAECEIIRKWRTK